MSERERVCVCVCEISERCTSKCVCECVGVVAGVGVK
jgi:hypothetical protein